MENIIYICSKLEKGLVLKRNVSIDENTFLNVLNRCKIKVEKTEIEGEEYYKLVSKDTITLPISTSSNKIRTCNFACLSDIHAGYRDIDLGKLDSFLSKAKRHKIKYMLIAGDLFEGIYNNEENNNELVAKTPEEQAKILFDVFKNYDFCYIFINGNHDYSFEINGLKNPNEILLKSLRNAEIESYFLDTFFANVIINGIGIRLIHLNRSYNKNGDLSSCIKYTSEIGDKVCWDGNEYPLSVVIAGHIHLHEFYKYKQTLILQPGSIKNEVGEHDENKGFIIQITIRNDELREVNIM